MDENWKILTEFVEKYKDTLVIDSDRVYVLRGLVNGEEDYYYSLQDIKGLFSCTSCVGRLIPLKGFIAEADYNGLKYYFQINLERLAEIINQEVK